MSVKLEEQIFEKYPLLKKLETGAYKIVIDEYIVMLHAKSESNKVALLRDGLNLNIPNKFISDNRDEAIQFFMNVIDAVMENVNCQKSFSGNENIEKRYLNIPTLKLPNINYYQFISGELYYVN